MKTVLKIVIEMNASISIFKIICQKLQEISRINTKLRDGLSQKNVDFSRKRIFLAFDIPSEEQM